MADSNRFSVIYQIQADTEKEARRIGNELCIEQTAELPEDVIPDKVRHSFLGEIQQISSIPAGAFHVTVSFPVAETGGEVSQFLNLLNGNISLKRGIRILDLDWQPLTDLATGPRFGISGIRNLLEIPNRPLSCTALKPVGLNFAELADLSHRFAIGGIDLIKDDHGLSNQEPAPFVERVKAVTGAIRKASNKTGKKTAYFPNITADGIETWRRYEIAADLGADGVLIIPQITGLSTLHSIAKSHPPLPIMCHPAFSGSYVLDGQHGCTPAFYYGSLWRALGADAVIYPNAGGRFAFTKEECLEINGRCRSKDIPFKPIFPIPAGGIQRDTIKKWMELYGQDTIFLVGGSLYQHPNGLETAAREFQNQIEEDV
ncbi:MAG: RuBisCO large subunit C-terminal-like domain-containing protein [Balneolaceae bacterium]